MEGVFANINIYATLKHNCRLNQFDAAYSRRNLSRMLIALQYCDVYPLLGNER
jgi:hypothetical protein